MKQLWANSVEQIAFTALENKTRVLGITSPTHGDNVADLAAAMAGTLASSGSRTILIDLSQPVQLAAAAPAWLPGDSGTGQSIRPTAAGFDLLQATPTAETRLLFSNADLYRRMFSEELRHYNSIVIEMPPVMDGVMASINPVGPSLACDSVIMMCTTGQTTRDQMLAAVAPLRAAGAKLTGIVMNDSGLPTLAEELAREVRRLRPIAPALADWLEKKILSWELLNSR